MKLFDRVVTETVRSGNEPLKLTYVGIYDGHLGEAIAYRTQTELFCSSVGALKQSYVDTVDFTEVGADLTFRNVVHAIRELSKLNAAEKFPEWVSVKASASFLLSDGLYEAMTKVVEDEGLKKPEKICFEFEKSIFSADREGVRKGLTDLKTIGFKTMIGNFATDGFPITTLLDVPVDYVVLTPEVTALALDRNKTDVLPALVRFLRSMNVETIAAGVESDAAIKELNKMECFGILPSEDYHGRFSMNLRAKGVHGYKDVIKTTEENL